MSDKTFRNIYSSSPGKPLYSHVKFDPISKTKLKKWANETRLAVPLVIYPLPQPLDIYETIRVTTGPPLILDQGTSLHDFEFFTRNSTTILTSTSKTDGLIRLWELPPETPSMEHCRISSQPDYTLAGHQKRVECFTFHPIFQDLLASSSTDGCIKLWSLSAPSKELFSLSPLANDSEHFSQLAFDAFGCQIAGLTNQARLTLIDPRSSSVSSVTLESGHVKTKPCQLSWAHPDPILITTGFSKASTRQVKLWDQRNLKESMQVLDLGLGVAPFQIFWDDSLPLLYLTARNEAIQILELRQGTMKPVAQVDGAATGYAMLSKKNNNTAKCEIARFLRLSSDNRIDYTSIMVPRLNSGTVFQTDLYPTIQPIVLEYPGDWTKGMDQLDVAVEMACLKGSLRASNVPLGSYYIKSPPVSTTYPTSDGILQSDLRDLHSIAAKSLSATAILEQRGWFWSTWTRVVLRIRKNFLYVTALQDSTAILMVRPSHVKHIFMFPLSSSGHGLSMVYKGEELRFEMTSYEECQEWMEELENRIMLGDEEHIPGTPKRTVILLGNMRLLNQNDILQSFHQSERTLVLEEDMTLCIYASNQSYCAGEKPMNVLCLSELIGLHPVSLFASQCPSGNRSSPSSLPVSIFKLIFSDVSWFFLAKSQAIKELWIRKIRDSVSLSDFPGNNPIFYVELGKIPQSTRLLYKISGQGLWLTLLSDRLLYTESRFSRLHSAMLEIKSILSVNRVGDAKCGLHVEVTLTDGTTISHIFLSERQATEFTEAVDWMLIEAQDITKDLGFYLSRDIEAALDKLYNFSDMLDVLTLSDKIQFVRMLIRISGQHDLELVEPSFSSLTLADSFILIEDKMSIYHWHGSNSSFICRAKALDIATRIRKHLRDVPKVFLVDESDLQLEELFFMKLGSAIPRAMNFPAREIKEPLIKVFRVSSQSKKQICVVSSVSRPSKCVLLTTSSFVVQFNNIYFAWIGADSLQKDGRLAKMFAKQMAKLCSGYAALIYMNEGCEHPLFCESFKDFATSLPISMHYEDIQGNVSVKPIQPEIDVALLLKSRDALRPSGINDRPVKTQVFRISNFQKIEMPASAWGHFSSAESYLISYAYRPTHSYVTKGVAYLYQGLRSSTIEKGTAAMLTVDLAKECEDNVTQIRIEQGKEPLEFALLFGYTLVSFYDEVRELSEGTPITFDVRMSRDTICRAIQVSSVADICAPVNNVIVFCFSSNAYIWIGSYSVDEEKACATALARRLGCHSILEFEEPDFSSLDKALSSRMIALPSLSAKRGTYRYLPRFFTASGATGIVEIEELHSFTGQDLFGVCILDVLHTVYIWINEEVAKPDEKRVAIHAMMKSLNISPEHINAGATLRVILAGSEPNEFREAFQGYTVPKSGHASISIPAAQYLAEELDKSIYSIQTLLSPDAPNHIDRTKLETYLSQDDFEGMFQMAREDYFSLPPWKRNHLKRSAGLF